MDLSSPTEQLGSQEPKAPSSFDPTEFRKELSEDPVWAHASQLALHALQDKIIPIGPFVGIEPEALHVLCLQSGGAYRSDKVRIALLDFLSLRREDGEMPTQTRVPESLRNAVPVWPQWNSRILSPQIGTLCACHAYVHHAEDVEFLNADCMGATVQQRILNLLDYLWMDHWTEETGLFGNDGNLDAFELRMLDKEEGGSGPTCFSAYMNLRVYQALQQILPLLSLTAEDKEKWNQRLSDLGQEIQKQFWNEAEDRLIPHVYENGSSIFPDDWVEAHMFLPHTTALLLETDLLTEHERFACLKQMKQHLNREISSTFGMATYPAYPTEYLTDYDLQGWERIAGSDHTRSSALTGLRLIRGGHPERGMQVLKRIAERICEDSRFYEWYTPDHCPQRSDRCRASASAFLRGLHDLKQLVGVLHVEKVKAAESPSQSSHRFDLGFKQRKLSLRKDKIKEKRSSRRLPLSIPAEIQAMASLRKARRMSGMVRFPSQVGLCLQTTTQIPEGSMVKVYVKIQILGAKENCKLKGHVVWSHRKVLTEHYYCGVELVQGNRHQFKRWNDFILARMRGLDV